MDVWTPVLEGRRSKLSPRGVNLTPSTGREGTLPPMQPLVAPVCLNILSHSNLSPSFSSISTVTVV